MHHLEDRGIAVATPRNHGRENVAAPGRLAARIHRHLYRAATYEAALLVGGNPKPPPWCRLGRPFRRHANVAAVTRREDR